MDRRRFYNYYDGDDDDDDDSGYSYDYAGWMRAWGPDSPYYGGYDDEEDDGDADGYYAPGNSPRGRRRGSSRRRFSSRTGGGSVGFDDGSDVITVSVRSDEGGSGGGRAHSPAPENSIGGGSTGSSGDGANASGATSSESGPEPPGGQAALSSDSDGGSGGGGDGGGGGGGGGDNGDGNDQQEEIINSDSSVSGPDGEHLDTADIAVLLNNPPRTLLRNALVRKNDVDEMNGTTVSQTVLMIEHAVEKVKTAKEEASAARRRQRSKRTRGNADAVASDNTAGGEGGNDAGNASDASNASDRSYLSDGSLIEPAPSDAARIPGEMIAEANILLGRCYMAQSFERRSPSRAINAYRAALAALGAPGDSPPAASNPALWATVRLETARVWLARGHEHVAAPGALAPGALAMPQELGDGTAGARGRRRTGTEAVDDDEQFGGGAALRDVADLSSVLAKYVREGIREAHKALLVFEKASTPRKYAETWTALGEAYARRADLPPVLPEDGGEEDDSDAGIPVSENLASGSSSAIAGSSSTAPVPRPPASAVATNRVSRSLSKARSAYENALAVVEGEERPEEWARICTWLAQLALRTRMHARATAGEAGRAAGDDSVGAEAAQKHVEAASRVYNAAGDPLLYGNNQHLLGVVYAALGEDALEAGKRGSATVSGGDADVEGNGVGAAGEGSTIEPAVEGKAARKTARLHYHRAVKAFSRALGVKTWSLNAGFDYSNTVVELDSARSKLAALQAADALQDRGSEDAGDSGSEDAISV